MTTDVLTNGHHPQGRAAPAPNTYTFPNGKVATLHAVSQFTQAQIDIAMRKKYPAPPPPLNEVDYGDGVKKLEPNPSDPAYELALYDHRTMVGTKRFEAIIDLAADLEVDQDELGRVRSAFERSGLEWDEISDKVAYIKHCCVFDVQREMPKFMQALSDMMGPKEEDVADHVDTFPN